MSPSWFLKLLSYVPDDSSYKGGPLPPVNLNYVPSDPKPSLLSMRKYNNSDVCAKPVLIRDQPVGIYTLELRIAVEIK